MRWEQRAYGRSTVRDARSGILLRSRCRFFGGPVWTQTRDLQISSLLFYSAELRGHKAERGLRPCHAVSPVLDPGYIQTDCCSYIIPKLLIVNIFFRLFIHTLKAQSHSPKKDGFIPQSWRLIRFQRIPRPENSESASGRRE